MLRNCKKISMWTTILGFGLNLSINIFLVFCHLSQRKCSTLCRMQTYTFKKSLIAISLFSLDYLFYLFSFSVVSMLWIFDATATVLKDWACSSLLCDTKGINCEKQGAHICTDIACILLHEVSKALFLLDAKLLLFLS